MAEKVVIYLNGVLPAQYTDLGQLNEEKPVESIEELCEIYNNKYGSFGSLMFYIYKEGEEEVFIESLNDLFAKNGMTIKVDRNLLEANLEKFTPMIVVNEEIISRGIYPDLATMRGGKDSVTRGGDGGHHHH